MKPVEGRKRVIIEEVQPQVDCGRYAAKRVLGDAVTITAAIFGDGHQNMVLLGDLLGVDDLSAVENLLFQLRGVTQLHGGAFRRVEDGIQLVAVVDKAIERPDVDSERLGVTGYSYGGFMTSWIIGHTNRFKAAVIGAPVANLVSFYGTSDIAWYNPTTNDIDLWLIKNGQWVASIDVGTHPAGVQHVRFLRRIPLLGWRERSAWPDPHPWRA